MRPSVPDIHITDSQDAEFAEYRALPGQAVVGLIFGLLSPLALVSPMLWIVPVVGVFFGGWALRRIQKHPAEYTGRTLAWAGLSFSLLLAAAAPTDWLVFRRMVRDEARQFSAQWFHYLADDRPAPEKAFQLTLPPQSRQPLGGSLWGYYRGTPKQRQALEGYVQTPLVRTLLALGPKAVVRFYDTIGQAHDDNEDFVEQCYAVTYEEGGELKSFFVGVQMQRTKVSDGASDWRVVQAAGGVKPQGW